MEIKIKLLSDLCTYSGETYNSKVDTDITYDKYGIPYIAAKRIKGCIREAALEMKEMGLISQEQYNEIFGEKGDCRSAFSLSNAYLLDYEQITNMLENCRYSDIKSPQNVLNQYTYTRTQTAVDMETGVADENTLRTMRVVRKGLVFKAEISWVKEVSVPEILEQAVSLVKHIGVARTRGLGQVDMRLDNIEGDKIQHVLFEKKQLGEENKIRYVIRLKSPVICKSPQGNQEITEDYIAGSKVLGLIAGAMKKEEYQQLISRDGELIISNGYIMNEGKRCIPSRISLQKEKDETYDSEKKLWLKDMLLLKDTDDIKDKQMVPANIHYIDEEGNIKDVITEISYHHQRPNDKSVGRATGKDGSSFYQLSAISAGQSFCGYVYADREQAEQIMDAMERLGEVRIGYGRSSEFGAVELVFDHVVSGIQNDRKVKDAAVTLVSDVLLYNERGMMTTDIRVLEAYLRDLTGTEDLVISHPYLRFTVSGGYNVTWKCRKPISYAFGKGSTFLIHSSSEFDISTLDGKFIGERVSEGYGELQVKCLEKTANICVRKKKENKQDQGKTEESSELLECLLQSEFERRIQKMVRENIEIELKKSRYNCEEIKAAVSKLRIIFKNEKSYEMMKEQATAIEKEKKNRLCTELVNFVDPDELAEKITEEMRRDYTDRFENLWSEERVFENVYRAYLTELKYFVKTIEKKGDNRA